MTILDRYAAAQSAIGRAAIDCGRDPAAVTLVCVTKTFPGEDVLPLLEAGHRVYGETRERTWPLSHVPLLIEESEWRDIAAGVVQRARLMEHILADIYGPGDLVKDGLLPAAAVTGRSPFRV